MILSTRTLNRALLTRQLLLERASLPAANAIEHLVGMQAQSPHNPYLALWSRLADFDPDDLSRLIVERQAVRGTLQRATIHLTTARDYLALRPVLDSVPAQTFRSSPFAKKLGGLDHAAVVTAGCALLEEQPRTVGELGSLLTVQWPGYDASSLGAAVGFLAPLIQVPPRGLWQQSGPARLTTATSWLGRPFATERSPDTLVMRYLAAFGPASVADIRNWSRLTGLREVVERLRPHLTNYRDDRGRELFDIPGALLPDPDLPAPPRFLPEYDNILLGHDDRGRIVPGNRPLPLPAGSGSMLGSLLVDGFLAGMWRISQQRSRATLTIELAGKLTSADMAAVADEGGRMLAFVVPDASHRDIRFAS